MLTPEELKAIRRRVDTADQDRVDAIRDRAELLHDNEMLRLQLSDIQPILVLDTDDIHDFVHDGD